MHSESGAWVCEGATHSSGCVKRARATLAGHSNAQQRARGADLAAPTDLGLQVCGGSSSTLTHSWLSGCMLLLLLRRRVCLMLGSAA